MNLHIQDPDDPESSYLLDSLREACQGSVRAGGAFAFLSAGGVQMFFRDEAFLEFAGQGGAFSLVAGVDAVTDTKAIAALTAAQKVSPSLSAKVHMPTHPRSIFHPKFAWFQRPNGSGTLVTGSGNLTAGGLRWNVEAFSVSKLAHADMTGVAQYWNAYVQRCQAALFDVDHPAVIKRLEQNAQLQKILKKGGISPEVLVPQPDGGAATPAEVDSVPPVTPDVRVLVAEIPRSGDRWKQANFDLATFTDFFGASTTQHREAMFLNVRPDGSLAPQEIRPAVAVKSQNYRFELEAASGLEYPKNGRPIGVFVRISVRTFLYVLLMPGEKAHAAMEKLLDSAQPSGARMRRIPFNADAVRKAWPTSPLWKPLAVA